MRVLIENDYEKVCYWVAVYIKTKINTYNVTNGPFVLGLPTGSTPLGVYRKLIQFCKDGSLSFNNVVTFNMDEYVGLNNTHKQSYHYFMHTNFFNHIDIPRRNINLLNGVASNLQEECVRYEKKIKHNRIMVAYFKSNIEILRSYNGKLLEKMKIIGHSQIGLVI